MSTEIYHFSGTGNSLYVARELQERLTGAKLIPMVSRLDQDIIVTGGETVGLVFPVHAMGLPIAVRRFLDRLDPRSSQYIFAVLTQGGTPTVADIYIEEILGKKGRRLDAFFTLKMPWNSPIGLMPVYVPGMIGYPPKPDRASALASAVEEKLASIQKTVMDQDRDPADDSPGPLGLFLKRTYCAVLGSTEKEKEKSLIPYYADSDCTGCAACERVCPSGRITMTGEKPVWQAGIPCYHCYACFAYCPVQSVLVKGRYTKKDGRYSHPEITIRDITGQSDERAV